MNGSLQKKGSIYYVVYRDCKGKQKWVNTKCKDKNKAKVVLRDLLYEMDHGTYIERSKEKFVDFLVKHFEDSVCYDVKITTLEGYMSIINNHIVPYFRNKELTLQDIKVIDLQEYVDSRYRQGLKTQTIKRHMSILKSIFFYAEDKELIKKDPTLKVRLHKGDKKEGKTMEEKCYSFEEVNQLLKAVEGDVIEPAIVLALVYGLRRGEMLGLRWGDIDFEKRTINIVNTITKVSKKVEKKPKTAYSMKEFPMLKNVEEYLSKLKLKQKGDAELYGNCYNNNDYVIRYSNGDPVSIPTLNNRFTKILAKNGLRHIRLHDLRHTVATLMLEEGFTIKVVQNWMRHANPNTLIKIYSHISPKEKSNMNAKIENFFTSNIDSSHVRRMLEDQGKQEEN